MVLLTIHSAAERRPTYILATALVLTPAARHYHGQYLRIQADWGARGPPGDAFVAVARRAAGAEAGARAVEFFQRK